MKKLLNKFLIFLRLKEKTFNYQSYIYVNNDGNVSTNITDTIRWLDTLNIEAYTESESELRAFYLLEQKYPQYKGYIYIF